MTATPRIYDDATKAKADEADAVLASMDDETLFGPEFHRLGFGEAVDAGPAHRLQGARPRRRRASTSPRPSSSQLADADGELQLDDAAKIVGCWNGLAKRGHGRARLRRRPGARCAGRSRSPAPSRPPRRSTEPVRRHRRPVRSLARDRRRRRSRDVLDCEVHHVDGTFNALRAQRRSSTGSRPTSADEQLCRILTNARCLSEGVDVPALDAVHVPRPAQVDRRRRPVRRPRHAQVAAARNTATSSCPSASPPASTPEEALSDNKRYQVVWQVLQALRAHDDRFDAMVNRIDLNQEARPDQDQRHRRRPAATATSSAHRRRPQGDARAVLAARRVARRDLRQDRRTRSATRRYWEDWAKDVADIAAAPHHPHHRPARRDRRSASPSEFDEFLDGLRGNLNDGITRDDAIEMLAQHLITRRSSTRCSPATTSPPTTRSPSHGAHARRPRRARPRHRERDAREVLRHRSARASQGIDNAEGKQRIIVELYEKFFTTAFREAVDKLGIVYTPSRSSTSSSAPPTRCCAAEFGQGLTDEGVHILDAFTGTGTFIVRLLQSGLIAADDLARKYTNELHANEILLLAYYIAAVNIETTYQDAIAPASDYEPFPGLVLTDTFQILGGRRPPRLRASSPRTTTALEAAEGARHPRDRRQPAVLRRPGQRQRRQPEREVPDARRSDPSTPTPTRSTATLKNSLYDSYIRAIRWATRPHQRPRRHRASSPTAAASTRNTADGMRKTLADEFSAIYVYNLRGNQRTAGEQSRKEGGKVFGGGSRATVAITLLVKTPEAPDAAGELHYPTSATTSPARRSSRSLKAATSRISIGCRSRRTTTATG